MMTEDNGGEFGHGAHADEPSRATSIEEKLSNIATWFDDVLKDTLIATPGRNLQEDEEVVGESARARLGARGGRAGGGGRCGPAGVLVTSISRVY